MLTRMEAYALVEVGDTEAVDVFLRESDAYAALEGAIRDEAPEWVGMLSVVRIELDERVASAN